MNIETPLQLFADHFETIYQRWGIALNQCGFDNGVIYAGEQSLYFHDDHGPPFKTNPNLVQWLPQDSIPEHSCLVVRPGEKPALLFFRPIDFWHAPSQIPQNHGGHFNVELFEDSNDLFSRCKALLEKGSKTAYIGESHTPLLAKLQGCTENPTDLIHHLYFQRGSKTPYELATMACASSIGVNGHLAAAKAFHAGASEFEIHLSYLKATGHNEVSLPYSNIIAQNEHASLLHYQHQERARAENLNSLLIDAGGTFNGYASDITRTHVGDQCYSAEAGNEFEALITSMDAHQIQLTQAVRKDCHYLDLHRQMHKQLAEVLVAHDLVSCSAEEAFEQDLTVPFCPHGLGHLLGIQVHDVGGHQISLKGEQAPPPESYSTLRLTRPLETNMVITIEPGLYFIPSLLKPLRQNKAPLNWSKIEALIPFGGIRIEDNVCVTDAEPRNLTREAFARADNG
jgi:Xaa-Pro dipeptidase